MIYLHFRAIEEIRCNDDIRVVILTGSGPHFCAGGDMKLAGELDPTVYLLLQISPTCLSNQVCLMGRSHCTRFITCL